MHQNVLGSQAPTGPTGGAYSAPPDPLAGLMRQGKKGKGGRNEIPISNSRIHY